MASNSSQTVTTVQQQVVGASVAPVSIHVRLRNRTDAIFHDRMRDLRRVDEEGGTRNMEPEEYADFFVNRIEEQRAGVNQVFERVRAAVLEERPDASDFPSTEEGQQAFKEAEMAWMAASQAALLATSAWTQSFLGIVDEAIAMLKDVERAIKEGRGAQGLRDGNTRIKAFRSWFGQKVSSSDSHSDLPHTTDPHTTDPSGGLAL